MTADTPASEWESRLAKARTILEKYAPSKDSQILYEFLKAARLPRWTRLDDDNWDKFIANAPMSSHPISASDLWEVLEIAGFSGDLMIKLPTSFSRAMKRAAVAS